jgi:hypothetical protein
VSRSGLGVCVGDLSPTEVEFKGRWGTSDGLEVRRGGGGAKGEGV